MPEPDTRADTHYTLLGLQPTASPQQIRRAFRDLSKLYHPDTTDLPSAVATEKFQQLNEAYAILSNPERRWSYDKKIGYSRLSVVQPLEPLYSKSTPGSQRKYSSNLYLDPTDRPLSAGEMFALFILGLTFIACLVLVVTIGFTRGETAGFFPAPEVVEANPDAPAAPSELPSPSPSSPSPLDHQPGLRAPTLPGQAADRSVPVPPPPTRPSPVRLL